MTQDGAWGHRRGLSTRRTAQHGEGEEQSGDRRQMCEELVAARCARLPGRAALAEGAGDRAGGTEVR